MAKSKSGKPKNTGSALESRLQEMYTKILAFEGDSFQNVRVDRRARIASKSIVKKGKPLLHEIDLYWEFRSSGILHKVCVQAKDDEVSLGMVHTFKSVLDDIAGQPRGMMVTTKHFHSGAFATAQHHGIELYALRPPDAADGMTKICISLRPSVVETRSVSMEYDELPRKDMTVQVSVAQFFDAEGKPYMTVPEVQQLCMPPKGEVWEGLKRGECTFDKPTYIHTGDERIERVQVKKVQFEFELVKLPERDIVLSVDEMLQSLTGAQSYFRDNTGAVRPKS